MMLSNLLLALALSLTPLQTKPIPPTSEMQIALRDVNRDVEMAQLKKTNLILRMRLILKVPNDYEWDEAANQFLPPEPKKK